MNALTNMSASITNLLKPHPGRDWLIIFGIMLVVFIAVIAFAAYLFFGIRTGRIVGSSGADTLKQPTVTRGEIDAVLENFRMRQLNFNERNFPLPPLVDPR